jgi:hypothetical protein
MAERKRYFWQDDPEKRKYYEGMRTAFSMMALWLDVEDILERRETMTQINLKFRDSETDRRIAEHLKKKDNITDYIRRLILEDMEKNDIDTIIKRVKEQLTKEVS